MGGGRETPPLQATIIDRERKPPLLLHRRWGLELLLLMPQPSPPVLVVDMHAVFVLQEREPPSLWPLDGRGHEPPPCGP